jgi:hypothetical protein
MSSIP